MVEENLKVISTTISEALMLRALNLGLEQITQYGLLYREAINQFKTKHFEDRSQVFLFSFISYKLPNIRYDFLIARCRISRTT